MIKMVTNCALKFQGDFNRRFRASPLKLGYTDQTCDANKTNLLNDKPEFPKLFTENLVLN